MIDHYLHKRGDWYQYRRRVPGHVAHLDGREQVKISLKTKDRNKALLKAGIYNDHIENFWKALVNSGNADNLDEKYKAAVQLAKSYGFAYKTAEQIAQSSINEIVERITATRDNQPSVEAVLGGVDVPKIMLADCADIFFDLTQDRIVNKSQHQIRKWKTPRRTAIETFTEIVSNKPVHEVSRADAITFKNGLNNRIKNGLAGATANKQMAMVKDILRTVALHHEVETDFEVVFAGLKFQYNYKSRPPFEATYVQNTLLSGLHGLNERDRLVIMAMADTGARESEIFGLAAEDIFLDEKIPFIWIRPREGHNLKTATSERKIPLVGTALYAFQQSPGGFFHKGNPDVFSNIANNYLKDNNLKPTPQHSVYSLRHTFKDRLRDIEAPEEIIDELMGHKKSGPKYGRGHKLETKYKWLQKIAFKTSEIPV